MKVVLLTQRGDLRHHRGGVVNIERILTAPTVYQQDSLGVYSVPIRPLARENKASGTESKAIFTEAKATSIINMAHIIV